MREDSLSTASLPLSLDGMRAILFDLDGTLRHSRPTYDQRLCEIASQLGLMCLDEARLQALRWGHYYWAQSPELLQDFEIYAGDWDGLLTNYVQQYTTILGYEPEQAEALAPRIYQSLAEMDPPQNWVDPSTPGMLETLKEAGFTLAVVSNRHKPFRDLLDSLGLAPYFEFALAAGEVNSWKPDPSIFWHAMQRAGSCPTCTIYVGDNYYADVIGAQNAGLQPVLLDPESLFPEAKCPVICSLGELGQSLA